MTDDKTEFPKDQWPALEAQMKEGGVEAVLEFARGWEGRDRLNLLNFAFGAFSHRDWEGKNLDAPIALAEATIAGALEFANEAEDDETRVKRTDFANVVSYNLSANLADCWPGESLKREQKHFERGLKAAEDCIRWREELKKPPMPFAIAWWAKGMHLLSLGRKEESLAAFIESQRFNIEAARAEGKPAEPGPDASFGVNLGAGYVGVAEQACGKEGGKATFDSASAAFDAQVEAGGEAADDAKFGLDQLKVVAERYL
ncbi:MAG: hypothetical protein OEY28_13720 [Nitrospira sp.]|nr:hypothetical protein [Nitrospira sp.]